MKPEKPAGPSFVIQNGAAVKTKPIDWLWPGMLARGKVHVLAGRGGMGKTTLMLKVAATISNGGFFPDCQVATDAGNVLYISGEDDAGDTLIPRFRASGGEPERIFLMNGLLTQDGQFLSIVDHHKWFEDEVRKNEASLLILDPATEFCGTTMDNNSAIHVRAVIGRLQQIAEVTHAAIVCLTHLTKRNDGEQVSKVLGSGAWTHAPRIVWGVDENEGSKYLGLLKSNISPMDHVYPYNLSPSVVDGIEAHHVSIGRKVPGGYFSDYGDLAETQKGQKIITATEFLRDRLMDRSAPKQTIVLELTSHGISESTITRAARELGVVSDRSHKAHGPAVWSLP